MQSGKTATVCTTVTKYNTAKAVGSGSLEVFATPMMIALMEQAACECIDLTDGQTSVGTEIAVSHTAASPLGARIRAIATIEQIDGRKVEFKVSALDDNGEIGKGRHVRFVVDAEKFIEKANARKQPRI